MTVLLSDACGRQVGVLVLSSLLSDWPLGCDLTPADILTGSQVDQIRFSLWGAHRVTSGATGAYQWMIDAGPCETALA